MKILGIKLTHDGAFAVVDNGKLIFSYEMEKFNNNPRLASFSITFDQLEEVLGHYGYSIFTMDEIAIDGWGVIDIKGREQNTTLLEDLQIRDGEFLTLEVARYGRVIYQDDDVMAPNEFSVPELGLGYSSYMHVSSHIFSGYCTSPFAEKGEDSYILVWDGGMCPQLFHYDAGKNKIASRGPLFALVGDIYTGFAHDYPPFNAYEKNDYSVAGKLMAYIALGNAQPELLSYFNDLYTELVSGRNLGTLDSGEIEEITQDFIRISNAFLKASDFKNEDILCSFHIFLENMLTESLENAVKASPLLHKNLCFAGGCALSIKWNSAIRNRNIFEAVWVPPFPNDSGSAIGAACSAMIYRSGHKHVEWSVYSGTYITENAHIHSTYSAQPCSLEELATLFHEKGEPVVFLSGRAELGPRALGNRSILAPPAHPGMKSLLNKIKGREDYRPVAPLCLEADAGLLFSPGNQDPYMLFDHQVSDLWKDKIPAVVHLDGSARLQTVNGQQNKEIFELLEFYKSQSGIPLLCNTSANFNGRGFFPSVASAMEWDELNYIWCNNTLYVRNELIDFTPYLN